MFNVANNKACCCWLSNLALGGMVRPKPKSPHRSHLKIKVILQSGHLEPHRSHTCSCNRWLLCCNEVGVSNPLITSQLNHLNINPIISHKIKGRKKKYIQVLESKANIPPTSRFSFTNQFLVFLFPIN